MSSIIIFSYVCVEWACVCSSEVKRWWLQVVVGSLHGTLNDEWQLFVFIKNVRLIPVQVYLMTYGLASLVESIQVLHESYALWWVCPL